MVGAEGYHSRELGSNGKWETEGDRRNRKKAPNHKVGSKVGM
jgi:hypothetical protein